MTDEKLYRIVQAALSVALALALVAQLIWVANESEKYEYKVVLTSGEEIVAKDCTVSTIRPAEQAHCVLEDGTVVVNVKAHRKELKDGEPGK